MFFIMWLLSMAKVELRRITTTPPHQYEMEPADAYARENSHRGETLVLSKKVCGLLPVRKHEKCLAHGGQCRDASLVSIGRLFVKIGQLFTESSRTPNSNSSLAPVATLLRILLPGFSPSRN